MTVKRIYKFSSIIAFFSLIGTAVCQIGMLLTCLYPGSVMHMPSLKSTALVFAVAFLAEILVYVLLEYVVDYSGRTSAWLVIISAFLLLAVIQNLLHPLTASDGRVACRYPMLAAIGCTLCCCELLSRKTKPDFRKLFGKPDFRKPETIFAAISLIFGLGMSLILPVETVLCWDDETHYKSTLVFSEGLYTAFDEGDVHMFYNYWDGPAENREENIRTILEKESQGNVYLEAHAMAFDLRNIGYVGPAAGLWLGEILQLHLPGRFILGRIGGLSLYILVMYHAIRRLKSGKLLLLLLGLSPMALYVSCCYSYDAWMLAFTSLSFACFFAALQRPEEKLTGKECIVIIGSMILGICPKMPYAPLMLLLLFLPKEKFRDVRQRKCYILGIFGCMAFAFLYTLATSFGAGDVVDARGGENISGYAQVVYIAQHFKEFIGMLTRFVIDYVKIPQSQSYLSSFAQKGSTNAYTVLLIAMLVAAITDSKEKVLTKHVGIRFAGIAVIVFQIFLIAAVFYVVFTEIGAETVKGCQQRYMLPLLFPSFMLLGSGWLKTNLKSKKWFPMIFYGVSVFCVGYNICLLVLPKV